MPWGRMDDKFHRNRKVRELRRARGGRAALGTWVYWWSWCLDDPELTGFVPADELPEADEKAAELLVSAGLWDRVEGGYRFHDFDQYNPTKTQVETKKEADRTRIAGKRAVSRLDVARDTEATFARVASTRVPIPSHPNPSQPVRAESASASGLLPEPAETPTAMRVGVDVMGAWNATLTWNGGWRDALEEIGLKPPAEREAVMSTLRTDPWLRERPHLVNPGYVAKQWNGLVLRTQAKAAAPGLAATMGTPFEQASARSRAAERAYRAAKEDPARKSELEQLRAAWVAAARESDALREKCA